MLKLYKKSPLPFTGQKRNFVSLFVDLLGKNINDVGG